MNILPAKEKERIKQGAEKAYALDKSMTGWPLTTEKDAYERGATEEHMHLRPKIMELEKRPHFVKATVRLPPNPYPAYRFKAWQIVLRLSSGQYAVHWVDTTRYDLFCEQMIKYDSEWLEVPGSETDKKIVDHG